MTSRPQSPDDAFTQIHTSAGERLVQLPLQPDRVAQIVRPDHDDDPAASFELTDTDVVVRLTAGVRGVTVVLDGDP